ncbi:MAG TPA: FtsX-like permease family protein [Anaeromyxobacteraceae bacterium]|nr:FtsX-like permease family protein [Anaeromyxobacteraceae bacterium]
MRPRRLLHLARLDLAADRRGAALNAGAACLGAAALAFFVALGAGVGEAARRMFPGETRLVEVVPPSVSLGAVLGGGVLDDGAVARLAAVEGAAAAFRKLNLRVPVSASRPPEGVVVNWPEGLTVQVPAMGVDPGLVNPDLGAGRWFEDRGAAEPIPVVASARLIEVYNKTIAPSWNLRRLPRGSALVGLQFPVRVGHSIVPLRTEDRVVDGRLVLAGLSERVPLYTLAMPLATVRRLNDEYGKAFQGYSAVALLAARPDDVPRLAAAVRRMGFAVDESDRAMAERVGTVVGLTTGALALLALIMCGLAALAIGQSLASSVRGRVKEIAILQAVGATAADVRALVLAEAALVGLCGGVAGAVLARLAALAADAAAARALPDFPFRPETFFAFAPWLDGLAVGVAVLSALLGALAPAALAARVDPARTIS